MAMRVDHRVQFGVVVHLHLAVQSEATSASQNLFPKLIETLCQIRPLLHQNRQTMLVPVVVLVRRSRAKNLFTRVINFQRQNRQPINNQAGSLRIQGRFVILRAGKVQQVLVNLLHQVVSLLVMPVNRVFHFCNAGIRRIRTARLIFLMPKVEVRPMLGHYQPREGIIGQCLSRGAIMPVQIGIVMQPYDQSGLDDRRGGSGQRCGHEN